MEFPHVSATLAAFLLILQQVLMIAVGIHRTKTKVGMGIAEDKHLEGKVRRHGNLAENAAIFVAVLALTELSGAPSGVVRGFAIAFAIGRASHALGFTHPDGAQGNIKGNKLFVAMRVLGATATGWGGLGLGVYLAYSLAVA